MLVALNVFLRFAGASDCCVKLMKIQRQIFCREDKELTKGEYQRLVKAAGSTQLSYVIQTICGTGIRVSELQYITAEAVRSGRASVTCKKNAGDFYPCASSKAVNEIYEKSRRDDRSGICNKKQKAIGPQLYMAEHESFVPKSGS